MATAMNASSAAMSFAPQLMAKMNKVAPLSPASQFGPSLTAAQARAAAMTPEQRAAAEKKIASTAKDFEANFIASMMSQTYEHVDLGGGQGSDAFKTVMMQAIGKKIASGKGVGLAVQVQNEMLKMQGLR
jgi:Rod binding domain-containing protein